MEIAVKNQQVKVEVTAELLRSIEDVAKEVLQLENNSQGEVSILLVDDSFIHSLNRNYRNVDRPTDVLSFSMREENCNDCDLLPEDEIEEMLGDVLVSLETAQCQAKEYGHSLTREVCYLVVHGILHLLGYDHQNENDKKKMRFAEERVLKNFNLNR